MADECYRHLWHEENVCPDADCIRESVQVVRIQHQEGETDICAQRAQYLYTIILRHRMIAIKQLFEFRIPIRTRACQLGRPMNEPSRIHISVRSPILSVLVNRNGHGDKWRTASDSPSSFGSSSQEASDHRHGSRDR